MRTGRLAHISGNLAPWSSTMEKKTNGSMNSMETVYVQVFGGVTGFVVFLVFIACTLLPFYAGALFSSLSLVRGLSSVFSDLYCVQGLSGWTFKT